MTQIMTSRPLLIRVVVVDLPVAVWLRLRLRLLGRLGGLSILSITMTMAMQLMDDDVEGLTGVI